VSRHDRVAVVGQDPRFGGGYRALTTAFWNAAERLGRRPHLYFLSRQDTLSPLRRTVAWRPRPEYHPPLDTTAVPSFVPELDGLNQVAGGLRLARRLRDGRTVWVVAASAPYGLGAALSGRPYACWLATGLEDEWEARRPRLDRARRLALALNRPLLRALERYVIRRAVLVFGISPSSRDTIADGGGVPRERVGVLPIPVDPEVFAAPPVEEWQATFGAPVLVFVGRANDPRKNLPLLVDAFVRVRREFPEARLRLVGEPPPASVRDRLPEGVDVVGIVPESSDIAAQLRDATVFVLPSLQEGFGIVAAEALAAGLPVVSTPCGGPEELLTASGGGVVVGDFRPESYADALLALLRDPARARELRTRGREYVLREHSPERLQELLADAFAALEAHG
jgi:glycosyltransferase involved in cell wall biosynthesis